MALTAACAYAYVGARLASRRTAHDDTQRAMRFFSAWWILLSANLVLGGSVYAAAAFGWSSFEVQLVYAHVQRLLLAGSLVGLLYYLTYLLTGRDWLVPIAAFYALYYALLEYSLVAGSPNGVYVGDWRTDLTYARTGGATALRAALALMLIVPPVAGSLAYFRLFFRVKSRAQRYRIALVSWSLALWWVMAVLAGQREALGNESFQLVNRFAGLAAALVILVAYLPPVALQRWLDARPDASPVPDA